MDRARLKAYLDRGLSLERIGELEGKHPSTIGYWVTKHGLAPSRPQHGRRFDIDDGVVRELADQGLSGREIGARLAISTSSVYRRFKKLGISRRSQSRKQQSLAARERGDTRFASRCRRHGVGAFLALPGGRSRCARCNSEAVTRWRRQAKTTLTTEAGGCCVLCGFNEFQAGLQFHHLDPKQKLHGIAEAGATRSLARAREEAKKCVLLCANCHAGVEAGVIVLPVELFPVDSPEDTPGEAAA